MDSKKDESLFQVCEKSYVPDAEGRMGLYRYNYSRDNFCGNPGSRQHERPSLGGDLYHFKMAVHSRNSGISHTDTRVIQVRKGDGGGQSGQESGHKQNVLGIPRTW